jgi:purine catabolism regulator
MAEPYRVIDRAEQIHHALMRAASREATLDDLARILCPLIGRSVTFEDPGGKLLAHCSIDDNADVVRRETLEYAQTPPTLLAALEATGLDRQLRASEKPIRVAAMPEIGLAARVACPIRLGAELVGVVWILEGDEPLAELDHRAAEYAALVAAIHVAHQRELASLEATLGYASVLSLLESESDPSAEAEERVRLLGFDPERAYRVAIVVLPEEMPLGREGFLRRDRVAQRAGAFLKRHGAERLVSAVLNRVPLLLPEDVPLGTLLTALDDATLNVVAGRSYRGMTGAQRSYREALSLIAHRNRKAACNFDDVLVPRVLAGDAEARRTFIHDWLAPLLAQRGGNGLGRAVLGLARSGFRMRDTAVALGIHPNTLRYRLNRAAEVLGVRFDDPETQFALQLLARLLEYGEVPAFAAAMQDGG